MRYISPRSKSLSRLTSTNPKTFLPIAATSASHVLSYSTNTANPPNDSHSHAYTGIRTRTSILDAQGGIESIKTRVRREQRQLARAEKGGMGMCGVVFSEGYEVGEGEKELVALVGGEGGEGRWEVIDTGKGIERSFRFKGFGKAWDFMNAIAAECKIQKHHPEWSNVYNTVFIRWTTHSPPGLSAKDVSMAKFCDAQAVVFKEIVPDPEKAQEPSSVGKELADRVAEAGGDCCVPASVRKGK